jgi:uncharacterized protein (TIGR02099 family)
MKLGLLKLFRRLRTLLWTALTLLTVLAAVIVGIGKLLMPYSVHYQPELEAWLSEAFNQPVKVESFSGEWKAFGPRISLQGLTLEPGNRKSVIAINQAALDIKPLNALISGRPLYSFRIIGADLALERNDDGSYVLSGLGMGDSSPDDDNPGLRDVVLNGEVRLQDISLTFDDPEHQIHLVLNNVNGRFKMDGRRLAAEIQASVTERDGRRVIGDLDATVKVRLDTEQKVMEAQWHVKTGELMLADLVRQLPPHPLVPVDGRLNTEIWGEWRRGSAQVMQGVLDLRDAQLSSQTGPLVINHLNTRFNFEFAHRKNWRMDLSDLKVGYADGEWHSERFSLARNLPQGLGLWVSADYLELDYPLQLTQRIMATYNTKWPVAIPRRAQGNVTDLDLVLDSKWQVTALNGELEDGHFWGWAKGPDIEGVAAKLSFSDGVGDVSFAGDAVRLDWLRVFRRPVIAAMTDCRVEVHFTDKDDWQFDLNYCHVKNDDLSGFGRIRMAASEGKPVVDINVILEHGDISRFGDYWPENVMNKATLQWLRTSLFSGQLTNARYTMVGDLDDFPFTNKRGRLLAVAPAKGVHVRYADDWPHARQVSGTAVFNGPGMSAQGRIGSTASAIVDRISVQIANFKKPELDVIYQTSTGLPALAEFIRRTPLLDGLEVDPRQFVFEGDSEIYGHIKTPLDNVADELRVTGSVFLKGDRFTDLASGVVMDDISGTLTYNRNGLEANELPATFKGYPVQLDIDANWDAQEVFRTHVTGNIPVDKVVPEELLQSEPLFSRVNGTGYWDISLSVAAVENREEKEVWLEIFSGLEGISIDLPAPVKKEAESGWPLRVLYPIRAEDYILTADLYDRLQLKMELSEQDATPIRAAVQMGGEVSGLPAPGYFSVDGTTEIFDLDNWIDLSVDRFAETVDDEGMTLNTASIEAEKALVFDRQFESVDLNMTYEDGIIIGKFDSEDLEGVVHYYKNEDGAHSMTGEFERLIMPDPEAGGVTMETDPSELPEVHFYAREFSYLGLDLGETRIEGYPVQYGFHIESVEAHSPRLNFSARGDWIRDTEGERSDFDIRLTSESLGTVLEAMDISSAMQGGQTVVHFDAWWQGPPAAFALERLNGDMDVNVTQGNILTADPGAGRMLGLLSLTELPRRLAMDFRDVFGEGFSFDEAKGTMRLENGTSHTDDMVLSSTAAEITIIGNTDLVEQTFDYEFIVRPGVSKTLPVIGAIAGGPVGVAAGLALQALLRNALGEAAEARYTIRGPWEDPQVEPVGKLPRTTDNGQEQSSGLPPTDQPEIEQDATDGDTVQATEDDNNNE